MIGRTAAMNSDARETGMSCAAIAGPLAQIMRELGGLLAGLTAEQYTTSGGALFANSTVGGHVRHCLDHVRALVEGWSTGTVDYDRRDRGTNIEADVEAAKQELARLAESLERLGTVGAGASVCVSVMPARLGECVLLSSTMGRETAFVLSHTVHHNATIRGIVLSLGGSVPSAFGYAPSTLAHQDGRGKVRCAR